MKKIYLFLALLTFILNANGQNVGIGTLKPDESAILDLSSSKKGLLIPRLTVEERNNISSPANGLMIYQTDQNSSGFYFYNGKEWKPLNSASTTEMNSVATAGVDWATTGNNAATTDFIGTTNNVPLIFKVNNQNSGSILTTGGTTTFGYQAGMNNTATNTLAFGYQALLNNTSATGNIAVGTQTLLNNTSGTYNVGVGVQSLYSNTSGFQNFAMGSFALKANTSGKYNNGIGYQSLFSNTTGDFNIGYGNSTLFLNSTGAGNVAIGFSSLRNNVSGNHNLAIGYAAGFNVTGSSNILIGNQAGFNETGSNKLYISNSNTATPLLYGDFSAKFLSIGDIPLAKRDAIAAAGQYGLLVKGGIMSEKVKVALSSSADWADYVFETGYKLTPLNEVENFINLNKHLPNVPSADEMAENGLDVTQTSAKLMEKIEELTLYVIDLQKQIDELKRKN